MPAQGCFTKICYSW